jgi:hypothetical protein
VKTCELRILADLDGGWTPIQCAVLPGLVRTKDAEPDPARDARLNLAKKFVDFLDASEREDLIDYMTPEGPDDDDSYHG